MASCLQWGAGLQGRQLQRGACSSYAENVQVVVLLGVCCVRLSLVGRSLQQSSCTACQLPPAGMNPGIITSAHALQWSLTINSGMLSGCHLLHGHSWQEGVHAAVPGQPDSLHGHCPALTDAFHDCHGDLASRQQLVQAPCILHHSRP